MGLSAGNRKGIPILAATFWALVGIFVVIASVVVIPAPVSIKRMILPFMAAFGIAFFLLGLGLIFLTLKQKVGGMQKKFLILTGASAAGIVVGILLHNLVYGLLIYWFGADFWDRIGLGDEPFFFFLAIIVCPIGFLIGSVGSTVLFIKRRK
jgi:hypothetical protein